MTTRRFAQDTSVSTENSRAEIERTLQRYGADAFGYSIDGRTAKVAFRMAMLHFPYHAARYSMMPESQLAVGMIPPPACRAATEMQRIDGAYLYQLGYQLHPLHGLSGAHESNPSTVGDAFFMVVVAEGVLDTFLHNSIYKIRFARHSGEQLLGAIRALSAKSFSGAMSDPIDGSAISTVKYWLPIFESHLGSELALMDTYMISKKGVYDTNDLIFNGAAFMPADLALKVPEATHDVNEATKCLAYEVFTAVGFHIHRANEAVMHRYYDVVTEEKPRPTNRDIGSYLRELEKHKAGDARVKAALRDLKDLHRNPLIHPDQSLESADEAIDLLSAVRAVVGQMLKAMPSPQLVLTAEDDAAASAAAAAADAAIAAAEWADTSEENSEPEVDPAKSP